MTSTSWPPPSISRRADSKRDEQRHEQQEGALAERGQVLGLAMAVVVLAVGRAERHAHGEEGEQGGHEVGARVDRLGEERERARGEPGGELDRDEEHGRGDAELRRPLARAGVRALRARAGPCAAVTGRPRPGACAGAGRRRAGTRTALAGRSASSAASSRATSARAARPRWLMASFSSRRQLGHGALVARVVVRDEGGVVAEAALAARLCRRAVPHSARARPPRARPGST